uniref:Si:dkey-35m8.1 n=1 Tax=Cyprinus carpio TaxID=7962 RepID=A0A8C2KTR3_CYPCA
MNCDVIYSERRDTKRVRRGMGSGNGMSQIHTCISRISTMVIMASGLLVYPFGLNSSLVKSFCGDSDIYYSGECQIGWGYMLAIVGVMLTLFLPFFAKYAPKEQLSPTPLPTLL